MQNASHQCPQCGWTFDLEALSAHASRKCRSALLVVSVACLGKLNSPAINKYIDHYAKALRESPEDRANLLALALCYLRSGVLPLAERYLGKLIELHPADPSGYRYRAITLMGAKRPKLASLSVVRQAEELLKLAGTLEPDNGLNDLVLAQIRHDYYVLNGLLVPAPSPAALLQAAEEKRYDRLEAGQLQALLKLSGAAGALLAG